MDPLARGNEDMEDGGRPLKRRKVDTGMTNLQIESCLKGDRVLRRRTTGPRGSQAPLVHRQYGHVRP